MKIRYVNRAVEALEAIAHNSKRLVEELKRFNDWKELENGDYDSLEEFLNAGHQE